MVLSNNVLLSRISCNGSGGGYGDPNGYYAPGQGSTIEDYITQGAGYFLQGKSYIQSFLNQMELQDVKGMDFAGLHRLTANALDQISVACIVYENLVVAAKIAPYNPVVITRLKEFDYASFIIDHRLNRAIFDKVSGYLSSGNITGVFIYNLYVLKSIRWLLFIVNSYAEFDLMPPLGFCRKLNELCAELSLFGSYTARIFHSINEQY
jgi:hypothetical protein